MDKIQDLYGSAYFRAPQNLQKFGSILSEKVFAGLQFVGEERHIREEIPTTYIHGTLLGMNFILMQQYEENGVYLYELQFWIEPTGLNGNVDYDNRIDPNKYLELLLRLLLKDIPEVQVLSEDDDF